MRGGVADTGAAPPRSLAIVMPVLNEAPALAERLAALQPLRQRGVQLWVVDGGSTDASAAIARPLADGVLSAVGGRGAQLRAGAAACRADAIVFLHADTVLPPDADRHILRALDGRAVWGRFDVRLDAPRPVFRVIESLMNLRSRCSGIATGDQAIFVRRDALAAAGGVPAIALMEDVALSRALRRHGWPACLPARVTTSARRWERHGVWRTILLMWQLRAAYWLGADPAQLAARYAGRAKGP